MTKGSSSIKVAVIDQGVAGHEDLGDRLLPGFTPGLANGNGACLLYTSPSPRDRQKSRMPSSA